MSLTSAARRALELRRMLAKSSISKLSTILATVGLGDRLRNGYKFYGAHTGRWSAGGADSPTAQLQNLPRGTIADVEGATEAIAEGRALDEFGSPLSVISSCLRSAFRAPEGFHFVVADLAQIELRVLAWVSNCESMLNTFARNGDIYVEFGSRMYNVPTHEILKSQRQVAKSAVLGCGYGMGPGREAEDKKGDKYKSGLWGYAEGMGVSMTPEEATDAVYAFRGIYPAVPAYWNSIERAAIQATLYPGTRVNLGPLTLASTGKKLLCIDLPVGRRLHYHKPLYTNGQLSYEGIKLGHWGRRSTWGGHLTENVVQAIARDVLAEGMLRADAKGFEIVGHSHDESITLVPDDSPLGLKELIECMTETLPWAQDLPLAADGWEGKVYKK